ncbi:TetR/AcrR family transcriptional regulator [Adlercreutzia faecimuris]|uniref:TetR family transcriptional regulator n=1 Tax=Adlercreutzia faecimuris TaxID=2897341 RepID=A0ABS9WJI1_9ACTN|nr:TetR family transcriptional regulator [Adlercreutzia sp. JBNU-10]MCI2242642.1 TetR family transcriptional regulator [Adlercreutzia sp. JBNU-10]
MENPMMKRRIADAFIALAEEKDPAKVSVRDVSNALGINRKTFYYHFPSKEMLVNWIFRRDLGHALRDAFPQSCLVFEPRDSSPCANYPYYVHIVDGSGRLSHAEFFMLVSRCLKARPALYPPLLKTADLGSLQAYLFDLYKRAFEQDILFIFRGAEPGPEALDFMAEFYAAAFIGQIVRRVLSSRGCRTVDDVRPFENIIHGSLYLMRRELDESCASPA